MSRNQCHIKDCKKRDHKDCHKQCKKERFDSWSDSCDSVGEVKCYKECYRVCTVKCHQNKKIDNRWGYKTREEEPCHEVCEPPKLHKQCGNKNRKH
jgi:hypothetical protein